MSEKRRAVGPETGRPRADRGNKGGGTGRVLVFGVVVAVMMMVVMGVISASQPASPATAATAPVSDPDRIEVVYFHRTERCDSCLWADQVSRSTVETYFAQEYADGRVTFQELDVQKPENRAMAARYRAGGSQLFVNYVKDGQDHIVEARQTYPFVGNEARFSDALRQMIAAGLGES